MSTLNMHATILGKPVSCLHNLRASKAWPVSCTAPAARLRASCSVQQEVRRSGNYQPTRWDFSYIQSLNSPYDKEEKHLSRREELIVQVEILLQEEKMEHVQQLELIDDLKYLGLSYFFQDEIKEILGFIHSHHKCFHNNEACDQRGLYFTALGFRVLRQHGFDVSQEVFDCFKNEKGSDFKANLAQDTKGMILRLADDVGTAQFELKRGDVQKAVQCYMNDTNASEKEAKEHVMSMLRESWKEMNTAMAAGHPFEDILAESAANLGRVAQFMYLEGDGHGVQHSGIHKQIAGLLLEPYA
ncbi:hypothetical protein SASPL_102901 [Salvia splendens]|uniref:Terpene synthase N-terminal domain-containing protein n=1 Tax=Salvia splendens TaxID=180675 RepID=A0A8X8YS56_SALSN|nr:hypothetical protein SASPL_102901 [Salvia splendens]